MLCPAKGTSAGVSTLLNRCSVFILDFNITGGAQKPSRGRNMKAVDDAARYHD
eukprot:gene18525-66252_t